MKKLLWFLSLCMCTSYQMFGMSCITEVLNNTDYEVAIAYGFPCPKYDVIQCIDLQDDRAVLDSFQKTDRGIFLPPRSRTFLFGAGIPINRSQYVDDAVMVMFAVNFNKHVLPVYNFWQFGNTIFTGCSYKSNEFRIMIAQQITKPHTFTLMLDQEGDELVEELCDGKGFQVKQDSLHIGLLINDSEQFYRGFEALP